jgi:hypothetical protein
VEPPWAVLGDGCNVADPIDLPDGPYLTVNAACTGLIVTGKVADQDVVPRLEHQRDALGAAGVDVLRLTEVPGLVRHPFGHRQRARSLVGLDHRQLMGRLAVVCRVEGDLAGGDGPRLWRDREFLQVHQHRGLMLGF